MEEIAAVAHQPAIEARIELNRREAVALFGNDRFEAFLRIDRRFECCTQRRQLRRDGAQPFRTIVAQL